MARDPTRGLNSFFTALCVVLNLTQLAKVLLIENLDHLDTPPPLGVEIKSMYTVLKNVYFILMTLENTGGSRFKVVEN